MLFCIFKEFSFTGPHKYLFTMDVKSLYTFIPHNDGPQAFKFSLDKRRQPNPPTSTLLVLAELVLTTNVFTFNSRFYLQTSGVAMGSKLGPSYACLFGGHQEQLIGESYDGPLPCLIKRYIDDIVGLTSLPIADLQRFINYTNSFHQTLQFSPILSRNKAYHFLTSSSPFQTTESLHPSTTNLQMPIVSLTTNRHILRNAKTRFPTLNSAVFVVFVQMRKILSPKQRKCLFLEKNNYPEQISKTALEKVEDLSQDDALLPSDNATSNNRTP